MCEPVCDGFILCLCSANSVNLVMFSWILLAPCLRLLSLFLGTASLVQSVNLSLSLIWMVSQACPALTNYWVYLYKGPFEVAEATPLHGLPERIESIETSSSKILNKEGSLPSQVDVPLFIALLKEEGC